MTESLTSERKWERIEYKIEKSLKQLNIEYCFYPVQLSMLIESGVA